VPWLLHVLLHELWRWLLPPCLLLCMLVWRQLVLVLVLLLLFRFLLLHAAIVIVHAACL
jgi:hypothetical protein